jgi:hypothetical protein
MMTTTTCTPATRTRTIRTHYVVQTSAAKMPTSCWGRYRNVAVLEIDEGRDSVAMISERARGCRSIVWYRGNLHSGRTMRSADGRAIVEAEARADRLNARQDGMDAICTRACTPEAHPGGLLCGFEVRELVDRVGAG